MITHRKYTSDWPFRQDDERWGAEEMWHRPTVMCILSKFNHFTSEKANNWMRDFSKNRGSKNNDIENEGCLIASLAMVLHLLDHDKRRRWSPKVLNKKAKENFYYSKSGVALVTLYADLVCDVTDGNVQLAAKEEYPWEPGDGYTTMADCAWANAYISAPEEVRKNFAVMLKIGTHDDTIASHYLLLDPMQTEHSSNPLVLDPAMPFPISISASGWRLFDSYKRICRDPDIGGELRKQKITKEMVRGVWIFGRWRSQNDTTLLGPLLPWLEV